MATLYAGPAAPIQRSGTLSILPEESPLFLLQLCELSPEVLPVSEEQIQDEQEETLLPSQKFYRGIVNSPQPTTIPLSMIPLRPPMRPRFDFMATSFGETVVDEAMSLQARRRHHLKQLTKRNFKRTQDKASIFNLHGPRFASTSKCRDTVTNKVTKHLLFCNHCRTEFRSKTTYRPQFDHHLVNHKCKDSKRRQYVVGVRHRKCIYNCNPKPHGCIQFVAKKVPKGTM